MKTPLLTTLGTCVACAAFAQSGPYLFSGTTSHGAGQASLLIQDAELAIALPAACPQQPGGGWIAAVALRPGLKDLKEIALAGHLPFSSKHGVGLGLQHTGIEGYGEQRITLSYYRLLTPIWSMAVQADANRNQAEETGGRWAGAWSVSFVTEPAPLLALSVWLYNPTGTGKRLSLPTLARVGIRYKPSGKVAVGIELEKDWQHPLRLHGGLTYEVIHGLTLRLGAGTEPGTIHAGATWTFGRQWTLGSGWRYQPVAGSSLSASLGQIFRP